MSNLEQIGVNILTILQDINSQIKLIENRTIFCITDSIDLNYLRDQRSILKNDLDRILDQINISDLIK